MAERTLTEGARRAMERAGRIAMESQCASIEPVHLLLALLSEESRAFDALMRAGVTREMLSERGFSAAKLSEKQSTSAGFDESSHDRNQCESTLEDDLADLKAAFLSAIGAGDSSPEDEGVAIEMAGADSTAASSGKTHSREVSEILRTARRHAQSVMFDHEVSSHHLLAGLLAVPSAVSELLAEFGLTHHEFTTAEQPPREEATLPVTFAINWDADHPGVRTSAYRILDAAANRAREGLRVVEDFVRFTLDDEHLSRLLKSARHRLTGLLKNLDDDRLIAARDTQNDVGTTIHTTAEMLRQAPLDAARASLKRVQEAVRTLEEYSKVVAPVVEPDAAAAHLPEQFGQLRYELYTLEKAVLQTVCSQKDFNNCGVYLLLTAEDCMTGLETVLTAAMRAGVRVVQLREKKRDDRELLALARRVRSLTREFQTLFIMNDRPDLAVLCEADGVHVGQEELPVREVRRIVGPDMLIGVSTHSVEQACQAVLDGASYLGVGPVFSSRTKQFNPEQLVGLDLVRKVASEITLPWFAIGGIDSGNAAQVRDAGATRIAVSSAVCRVDEPQAAARTLVSIMSDR